MLARLSLVLLLLTSCIVGCSGDGAVVPLPVRGYEVVDIGTLGGDSSRAFGINDEGVVVGLARLADGTDRAFRYSRANGLQQLPTMGGTYGLAFDVNHLGMAAGQTHNGAGLMRAVTWSAAGQVADLGTLAGDTEAYGYAINRNGRVVGFSRSGATNDRPFVSRADGGLQELPTLGGPFGQAYFLNRSDQIVGYSQTVAGIERATLWSNGQAEDLGGPVGLSSYALKISDAGVVVGFTRADGGATSAFQWTRAEGLAALPTLGGNTIAYSVNEQRQIVGTAVDGTGANRAVLWADGELIDLNDRIDANSGWVLNFARAINERGEIAGYGTRNGQQRAVLLVPR
jgi:probable HAF family extracellular repeat protein